MKRGKIREAIVFAGLLALVVICYALAWSFFV